MSDLGFGFLSHDGVHAFVPPNVRRALGEPVVPLLSTSLAAQHAAKLSGPVVEVTWPGTSALIACLRAARRVDAALALVVPDAFHVEDPGARQRILEAILSIADVARYDKPLFLVRRVRDLRASTTEERERALCTLGTEVEAGFPSLALRPAELGLDDVAALAELVSPFSEAGVGIELEFEPRDGAALFLAGLDDVGMRFAAVRGAGVDDELGGALLVVDPLEDTVPEGVPCRVALDPFVVKGIARALPPSAQSFWMRAARRQGAAGALVTGLDTLAELDEDERTRVEALVYAEVCDALAALAAQGVAYELYAALLDEARGL